MWLRNQPENPAEKKAVGPIGDRNLFACDEAKGRSSAMDRRPIREIFVQVISELFLCTAANRDDDVRRAILFNHRNKMSIFDFQAVLRRDIAALGLN